MLSSLQALAPGTPDTKAERKNEAQQQQQEDSWKQKLGIHGMNLEELEQLGTELSKKMTIISGDRSKDPSTVIYKLSELRNIKKLGINGSMLDEKSFPRREHPQQEIKVTVRRAPSHYEQFLKTQTIITDSRLDYRRRCPNRRRKAELKSGEAEISLSTSDDEHNIYSFLSQKSTGEKNSKSFDDDSLNPVQFETWESKIDYGYSDSDSDDSMQELSSKAKIESQDTDVSVQKAKEMVNVNLSKEEESMKIDDNSDEDDDIHWDEEEEPKDVIMTPAVEPSVPKPAKTVEVENDLMKIKLDGVKSTQSSSIVEALKQFKKDDDEFWKSAIVNKEQEKTNVQPRLMPSVGGVMRWEDKICWDVDEDLDNLDFFDTPLIIHGAEDGSDDEREPDGRLRFAGSNNIFPKLIGPNELARVDEGVESEEEDDEFNSDGEEEEAEQTNATSGGGKKKPGNWMIDENGKKVKRRKTKEEKQRQKEERLNRLRSMGLIIDEKKSDDANALQSDPNDPGSKSAYAWQSKISLPEPIKLGYLKAELRPNEAKNLHQPKLQLSEGQKVSIIFAPSKSESPPSIVPQRSKILKKDLTCGDGGKMLLCEYFEKRPPLLPNPGMSSVVVNFVKKQEGTDESKQQSSQKNQFNPKKTIEIDAKDKSPFLANLPPQRPHPTMVNDLFVSPVFGQKAPSNLYLLVAPKKNAQQLISERDLTKSCKIRKLDDPNASIVLLGQTEPRTEAFNPNIGQRQSDCADFLDSYIPYQLLRKLKKSNGSISFQEVKKLFPSVNDNFLNKVLRNVCDKKGTHFVRKRDGLEDLDFKKQIPPSDLCRYESMQKSLHLLGDRAISKSAKLDGIRAMGALMMFHEVQRAKSMADRALEAAITGDERKLQKSLTVQSKRELDAAKFVVDHLILSSWFLTSSYVNMHLRRGQPNNKFNNLQMRLKGLGDPSLEGLMLSFAPEDPDVTSYFNKRKRKKDEENVDSDAKKGFGGTEFDLRRLSLEESERLLRAFGIEKNKIDKLDRWDRIMVVEHKASSKEGKEIMSEKFSKFARNFPRAHEEEQQERQQFQKTVDDVFELQQQLFNSSSLEEIEKVRLLQQKGESPKKAKQKPSEEDDASSEGSVDDLLEDLEKTLETTNASANRKVRLIPKPSGYQKPRKILRKTFLSANSSGQIIARVFYSRAKKDIDRFKQKQRQLKRLEKETETKLGDLPLGSDRKRKKLDHSRERARISQKEEEDKEKNKKLFDWYMQQKREHGEGWPENVPAVGKHRCGVCKWPGHKSNSKSCPLFYASVRGQKSNSTAIVRDSGNSIKIKLSVSKKPLKTNKVTIDLAAINKQKQEEQKQKALLRQNSRSYAEEDMYGRNYRRPKDKSRRNGPVADLHAKLRAIHDFSFNLREAGWFRKEVSRKAYPQYYEIILRPMDLSKIRRQLDTFGYSSAEDFLADYQQLYDNSLKFNGPFNGITRDAEKMLNQVQEKISKDKKSLDELKQKVSEMEEVVDRKKKARGTSSVGETVSVSSMASPSALYNYNDLVSPMASPTYGSDGSLKRKLDEDESDLAQNDSKKLKNDSSDIYSENLNFSYSLGGFMDMSSPSAAALGPGFPMASPSAQSTSSLSHMLDNGKDKEDKSKSDDLEDLDLANFEGELIEEEIEEEEEVI